MSHKAIIIGIAVVMALVVGFVLYSGRPPAPPPVDAAWEAELQSRSSELNKDLPARIDEDTVLETTAAKGNILEFRHTLISVTKNEVDISQTTREMYTTLFAAACTSAELQAYRDHGTTLQYVYYDKNGVYVLGVRIETTNCR